MAPNLFKIATKELSQDAFLTWLLQWADPSYKSADVNLHECAQSFVRELLKVGPGFVISSVKAVRQWHNIDICSEINNEHLLIIEDKKHAHEHSGQLETYYKKAESWCNSPKRGKPWQLTAVYLKTGYESANSLHEISKRKFRPVGRKQLIDCFQKHPEITNAIFRDFLAYLVSLEEAVTGFTGKPWNEWNTEDWIGFYLWLEIQDDVEKIKWFPVDAKNGKSWVFLLTWFRKPAPCSLFIQTESRKAQLCIKMTVTPKELWWPETRGKSVVRNEYMNYVLRKAKDQKLVDVVRPDKLGHGANMTVAVVKPEKWLGPANQLLDLEAVKAKLRLYIGFAKDCQTSWPVRLEPAGIAEGGQDVGQPPVTRTGPLTW